MRKGNHCSEEHKEKIRLSLLGYKHTPEARKNMSLARLGKHPTPEAIEKSRIAKLGEKHWNWKGDNVGYAQLHEWVRKRLPKPELCAYCLKKKKLDLANMTGIYGRDFKNWKYLCRSCHLKHDVGYGLGQHGMMRT